MNALIEIQERVISEITQIGYPKDIVRDVLIQTLWDSEATLKILQNFDWDNHDVNQFKLQAAPQQSNLNSNTQMNPHFMSGSSEQQVIKELMDFGYPKEIVREFLIQANWDKESAFAALQNFDFDDYPFEMQDQSQVQPQQNNFNLNSEMNPYKSEIGFMKSYHKHQQMQQNTDLQEITQKQNLQQEK